MFEEILQNKSIILARADKDLRYVWIYNPHPDFSVKDIIGKTDYEIDPNPGTLNLMELKKRVINNCVKETAVITFPLSNGNITYKIIAEPIIDESGDITGVTTVAMDITNILDDCNNVCIEKYMEKEKSKYNTIGYKIRLIRKNKGLTQKKLAEKALLSQSYISALENNEKNPTIYSLQLISKALNFKIKEFLDLIL